MYFIQACPKLSLHSLRNVTHSIPHSSVSKAFTVEWHVHHSSVSKAFTTECYSFKRVQCFHCRMDSSTFQRVQSIHYRMFALQASPMLSLENVSHSSVSKAFMDYPQVIRGEFDLCTKSKGSKLRICSCFVLKSMPIHRFSSPKAAGFDFTFPNSVLLSESTGLAIIIPAGRQPGPF